MAIEEDWAREARRAMHHVLFWHDDEGLPGLGQNVSSLQEAKLSHCFVGAGLCTRFYVHRLS